MIKVIEESSFPMQSVSSFKKHSLRHCLLGSCILFSDGVTKDIVLVRHLLCRTSRCPFLSSCFVFLL